MIDFKSDFLKSLQQKQCLHQVTHSEELDNLMATSKITVYIGFDCTAKSLHVGSLLQIMILRQLQKFGHQPIVLLGGGTTKIGDPSGKDEARQFLDEDQITVNLSGIKKTLEKFDLSKINPSYPKFQFVDNDEWLSKLGYIDFLRNFGRHFSVNRMLTFDSVKVRLDRQQTLSFLEFNYMILQAYDFYELNRKYNCCLQIGGSDQWGNIINGVELVRRISAIKNEKSDLRFKGKSGEVFGLTTPLLVNSDGKKMGKTVNGAVWLDSSLLSAYDYFQYFRNIDDIDVGNYLRFFTDLEQNEISKFVQLQGQEVNHAKEVLAFEATKICHGKEAAKRVLDKVREVFVARNSKAFEHREFKLKSKLSEVIFEVGATESKSEAKRMVKSGAVKLAGIKIDDENYTFDQIGDFELAVGKKKFFKIIII